MPPTEIQKLSTSWSPAMLNEFHKLINSPLPLSFTVLEKNKTTTFVGRHNPTSFRSHSTCHVSYRGDIPASGLENVSIVFNPVTSLAAEYKNYVGYIEIVNGFREETVSVPEIRCFFQEELGLCEIFNEMLMESKIFNLKMAPVYVYLDQSYCLKDKPPDELLKKKMPIKEISTFQKISFIE